MTMVPGVYVTDFLRLFRLFETVVMWHVDVSSEFVSV